MSQFVYLLEIGSGQCLPFASLEGAKSHAIDGTKITWDDDEYGYVVNPFTEREIECSITKVEVRP